MRVAVFNRHRKHETYAARVCKALTDAGNEVRYLGAESVGHGDFQMVRTVRPPWHGPIPPVRSWVLDHFDRRRWRLADADLVIDLDVKFALWVLPRGRNVRVLHRVDFLSGHGPRARMRRARARMVARRGDRFVVHTETAQAQIAAIIGAEACMCTPLLGPEPLARPAHAAADPLRVLFVGAERHEKGFDLLLAAAEVTGVTVECVGGIEYPLSDADLAAAYARCDLVVCPYRDEYTATGSASLVVAEALAYAAPILATPALRLLFPVGYRGVAFAGSATVDALANALRSVDVAALGACAALDASLAAALVRPSAYAAALLAFAPPLH